MPRRNRDRGADAARPVPARSLAEGAVGWSRTELTGDGEWVVLSIPGARGVKTYRCPGCDHEIRPGVGHVVAWPSGGDGLAGADQRRHWHTGCWASRQRRRPGRRRT